MKSIAAFSMVIAIASAYASTAGSTYELSPNFKDFIGKRRAKRSWDENDTINVTSTFDYNNDKVYGVNLGGWMVTEPYITPTLYWDASADGTEATVPVDEYHYCKQLGTEECHARLKKHWDSWIVESDFEKIKKYGFNTVRFPIGYWAFAHLSSDPYCFGQEDYLDKAIQWCRKYGLFLWIDLHGVPGSQNGFDNSGLRDHVDWQKDSLYVDLSLEILHYIMAKYGGKEYKDVVSAIQVLNEPLGSRLNINKLEEFYVNSYTQMRYLKSDNYIAYHDAFMAPEFWDTRLTGKVSHSSNITLYPQMGNLTGYTNTSTYQGDYYNIIIDHHRYEVFDVGQLSQTIDEHIASLKAYTSAILKEEKPKLVGEWAAAITDCAFWLNGVGRGARYDGSFQSTKKLGGCAYANDFGEWTNERRIEVRKLIEAQLDLYNQTSGFIFWCYKTEDAIEWDLEKLIDYGLFPQPLADRRYVSVLSSDAAIVSSPLTNIPKIELIVLILTACALGLELL
ncbi:hypothetical protein KL929_000596 [Ogataea haglerorum]|nr:hypothetical protein KL929_000596 [Ogataea haglerorum]